MFEDLNPRSTNQMREVNPLPLSAPFKMSRNERDNNISCSVSRKQWTDRSSKVLNTVVHCLATSEFRNLWGADKQIVDSVRSRYQYVKTKWGSPAYNERHLGQSDSSISPEYPLWQRDRTEIKIRTEFLCSFRESERSLDWSSGIGYHLRHTLITTIFTCFVRS